MIGVLGDRSVAVKIRDEAKEFLKNKLKLELSMEKTKITHLGTEYAKFLGYYIRCHTLKQNLATRRTSKEGMKTDIRKSTGKPKLMVPVNILKKKLMEKDLVRPNGKPKYIGKFIYLKDAEIIQRYNSMLRGYMNYYNMAENR